MMSLLSNTVAVKKKKADDELSSAFSIATYRRYGVTVILNLSFVSKTRVSRCKNQPRSRFRRSRRDFKDRDDVL